MILEQFTEQELYLLAPFVTNVDLPVFALVNLPEVVKAALFARYSRTHKSCRRLLLDEFGVTDMSRGSITDLVDRESAEALMDRVFVGYGDDSVAQLGGAHLACEGVSNIMTKLLEWSRLGAYLEQSTRYIAYDKKDDNGNWLYYCPQELQGHSLESDFRECMDKLFTTYTNLIDPLFDYFLKTGDNDPTLLAYRRACKSKAYDAARGLLPAATRSNLGIFASGQTYERIIMMLRATDNTEAHTYADMMLQELRKVIPSFLKRVDLEDRGVQWIEYLRNTRKAVQEFAEYSNNEQRGCRQVNGSKVSLTDFDPLTEEKIIAASLYVASTVSDSELQLLVGQMGNEQRQAIMNASVGDRLNRRHRPGRAFKRCTYRFDILGDYGAFRDLQRHRMLTIEWQDLSPKHGYIVSPAITALEGEDVWADAMRGPDKLWHDLQNAGLTNAAQYVIPFAYRIRFNLQMNVREAIHILELRTQEGCHPSYRLVCQEMHKKIRETAGHQILADAMSFVNHDKDTAGRIRSEQRAEAK